jgi:uncharacterized membrane protein
LSGHSLDHPPEIHIIGPGERRLEFFLPATASIIIGTVLGIFAVVTRGRFITYHLILLCYLLARLLPVMIVFRALLCQLLFDGLLQTVDRLHQGIDSSRQTLDMLLLTFDPFYQTS